MTAPPGPAPAAEVLAIVDLETHFPLNRGTLKAVEGVSLTLRAGETLCVVGESGSGKSVTARSILNIVKPGRIVGGHIWFRPDAVIGAGNGNGPAIDLCALDPDGPRLRAIRGARIAMIFQEPMSALSPMHTIGQQIIEAVRLHRAMDKQEARARAIELLRQVQFREPETAIDRYPFQLSGGMRQRALIAMALSCQPQVLIADEPTTALDVTTQAEILSLIRSLQQRYGMAVLLVTHDMGVVAEMADRVAVMQGGRVIEHGPVDAVFRAPREAHTRRLIEAARLLERRGNRAAGTPAGGPGQAPILSVRGLCLAFRGTTGFLRRRATAVHALRDVSFDVAPGEALGIVGESGSGKTTLARALLGIHRVDAGQARFRRADGSLVDLCARQGYADRSLYAEIRMIFQDPFAALNPRQTVEQIIAEPLRIHRLCQRSGIGDRVAALLRDVDLSADVMDRYPHAFSGGQRQRIGIARAMATNPRLVVADEPTSALDGSLRAQILDLLLELRNRLGLSIILISHDIGVVRYFCERMAVMRQGELVEIGASDQICDAPRHPYTAELLAAVPRAGPRHARLRDPDAAGPD
ncbi:MAG: ABC transporter ATP-binding protein [Geminicoccaceae bacterium]|nr:ABC transporter ATP-binding protein [Geminicoccaceae bacterium]